MRYVIFLFTSLLLITANADQTFENSSQQSHLLELYTSQGCSSCPPAQRWLSRYVLHKSLWVDIFPVVFHVDYWNYLGWSDPFSRAAFSKRQRTYHSQRAISSVYTPAFVVNGKEWRRWYSAKARPDTVKTHGTLQARLKGNTLSASYTIEGQLTLNIALLITDHITDVTRGENSGRSLTEDFIVTDFYTASSDDGKWNINLDLDNQYNDYRKAIVIWVSRKNQLKPLQVTGGWLH